MFNTELYNRLTLPRPLIAAVCILSLSSFTSGVVDAAQEKLKLPDDPEDVRARLGKIEKRIEQCRKEQYDMTQEMRKIAKEIYEKRSEPQEGDTELAALKEKVLEAEKRYRELLTEYRKKLMQNPEMKKMKTRKEALIEDAGETKQEYVRLMEERRKLRMHLNRLKSESGDASGPRKDD